ncbi:MAG: hypothetical protein J5603_01740, partial [Bacteroidales bacterium]|nr:hypothetical protein [Bacteroidales bacterium]
MNKKNKLSRNLCRRVAWVWGAHTRTLDYVIASPKSGDIRPCRDNAYVVFTSCVVSTSCDSPSSCGSTTSCDSQPS